MDKILFGTDYPTDSTITYNWTEHENKELKKTLSDSILTINGTNSYHIEAQMTEDEEIVFRVFEYGFGHSYKNRIVGDGGESLEFPQPCILYLDEGKKDFIPDEHMLTLKFKGLSTGLYITMGWLSVFLFYVLFYTYTNFVSKKQVIITIFRAFLF